MAVDGSSEVRSRLEALARELEPELERALAAAGDVPERLGEAMAYALLGGGKRLRPALLMATARACGAPDDWAWPGACAIEMVHVYSLVHDDLPAMDDDELRRGRPTVHKAFDEATAILVGDALLTLAFETLSKSQAPAGARVEAMRCLARAAGPAGMVGGQQLDLEGEGSEPQLARVQRIHAKKTAALISASIELGALLAEVGAETRSSLVAFGTSLGLAFQVVDDCLDVTATSDQLGKTAAKDLEAQKQTWPACVGVEASMKEAHRLVGEAKTALRAAKDLDSGDPFLDDLASFVVDRRA